MPLNLYLTDWRGAASMEASASDDGLKLATRGGGGAEILLSPNDALRLGEWLVERAKVQGAMHRTAATSKPRRP